LAVFLGLSFLPFLGSQALDFLHPSPGCSRAIVKPAKTLLGGLPEVAHQPSDHAHDVPQQRVVRWVMNVGLYDRSSEMMRMISRL
jgi:hypothetical protein